MPSRPLALAVVSVKGGVGKTTVTLGLAGAAWQRGLRTLVVDLDPQANATAALDSAPAPFSTGDVLHDGRAGAAAGALVASGWGGRIDVLPAERALEHRAVSDRRNSSLRLRTALTGVAEGYDLVLLDCPPSLGELTRNALAAATLALVVTEPSSFALHGADEALAAIDVVRAHSNLRLRPAGVLVNRVRAGERDHEQHTDELRRRYQSLLFGLTVPERSAVPRSQGAAVPLQAWHEPGARDVIEAFDDLLDLLIGLPEVA